LTYLLIFLFVLFFPFFLRTSTEGYSKHGTLYGLPIYLDFQDDGDLFLRGANYGVEFLLYINIYVSICYFVGFYFFNQDGFPIVIKDDIIHDINLGNPIVDKDEETKEKEEK
jgi:hypothetical protein